MSSYHLLPSIYMSYFYIRLLDKTVHYVSLSNTTNISLFGQYLTICCFSLGSETGRPFRRGRSSPVLRGHTMAAEVVLDSETPLLGRTRNAPASHDGMQAKPLVPGPQQHHKSLNDLDHYNGKPRSSSDHNPPQRVVEQLRRG